MQQQHHKIFKQLKKKNPNRTNIALLEQKALLTEVKLLAKLCKQRQTISVMPNKDKLEKKHVAN
jgi:hypothetical protein